MIDTIRLLTLEVFIRYIFIIIIGFGPVILLLKSFKFSNINITI